MKHPFIAPLVEDIDTYYYDIYDLITTKLGITQHDYVILTKQECTQILQSIAEIQKYVNKVSAL